MVDVTLLYTPNGNAEELSQNSFIFYAIFNQFIHWMYERWTQTTAIANLKKKKNKMIKHQDWPELFATHSQKWIYTSYSNKLHDFSFSFDFESG